MSTSTLQEDERIVSDLSTPFPENEIRWVPKGHGDMAYITARHAMNRLDEVVGPMNWTDDYVAVGDGLKCLLSVRIGGEWITKCGFGAGAGMKDADDDEKSAESSAFKRAAVKFGIGRYLYNNGVPSFCGDCPMPNKSRGVSVPATSGGASAPPRTAPEQRRAATGSGAPRQYDNYQIPPPGKAVFAWAKRIGDDYGVDLIPGMRKAGQALGVGTDFVAWSKESVNEICLRAIGYIKSLENYNGKFDHINTEGQQEDDGDGPPF